jgi:hypothetical protein
VDWKNKVERERERERGRERDRTTEGNKRYEIKEEYQNETRQRIN